MIETRRPISSQSDKSEDQNDSLGNEKSCHFSFPHSAIKIGHLRAGRQRKLHAVKMDAGGAGQPIQIARDSQQTERGIETDLPQGRFVEFPQGSHDIHAINHLGSGASQLVDASAMQMAVFFQDDIHPMERILARRLSGHRGKVAGHCKARWTFGAKAHPEHILGKMKSVADEQPGQAILGQHRPQGIEVPMNELRQAIADMDAGPNPQVRAPVDGLSVGQVMPDRRGDLGLPENVLDERQSTRSFGSQSQDGDSILSEIAKPIKKSLRRLDHMLPGMNASGAVLGAEKRPFQMLSLIHISEPTRPY